MKRKLLLIFLSVILVFSSLKAQKVSFALGLKVQYAAPINKFYSGDFMSGLLFNLKIGDNFVIEIDSGNWKSEVKEKANGLYPGELSITPILINGLFLFPLNKSFCPYLGIGFSYYFNHFQISEELITIPEITISQDVEDDLGFQTGIGFDYFLAQNLILNCDIKYCWISPKGKTIINDMNKGIKEENFNLNLNNILYRICIKIYF